MRTLFFGAVLCLLAWSFTADAGMPLRLMRQRPLSKQGNFSSTSSESWLMGGGASGLWPLPQIVKSGSEEAHLSPLGFTILTNSTSTVLNGAIRRYWWHLMFPFPERQAHGPHSPIGHSLTLSVIVESDDDGHEALHLHTDEAYHLFIPELPTQREGYAWEAQLRATTVFGALRGLETFSQTIRWNDTSERYSIPDLPLRIVDWPRFPWRGIMIDVSRHYLPVHAIKRTLDAMSYNKFNVLHIHATDAQSFPIQSRRYPNLTRGAWGREAVYTHQDLRDIVQYALERGIRVIPEWEMPGHAYGFGVGYPFMVANCPSYTTDINMIPLNIASDRVYDLLVDFIDEMTSVFPDEFIHTGGDETAVDCWMNDPAIKKWGIEHNMTDPYRMFAYFEARIGSRIKPPKSSAKGPLFAASSPAQVSRTMVVWQDVFNDNWQHLAHPEMVVEVWLDKNTLKSVVEQGYRALWAQPWYLDQQSPGMEPKPKFYEWVDTWIAFYQAEPVIGLNLTKDQESMILGGEGCMWGENVDETNIDSRVWPRAAAIAERLWSDASVTDYYAARPRLINFRCNSLARYLVQTFPVQPNRIAYPMFSKTWYRSRARDARLLSASPGAPQENLMRDLRS